MPKISGKLLNLFLLLLVLFGAYRAWQVQVEENALDLLPGEALRGDLELLQDLGVVNQVFISLETPSAGEGGGAPPELLAGAQALGEGLAASPLFREVFYRLPPGYEFGLAETMRRYLPVLAGPEDLAEIEARLAPERLRERLRQAFLELNSPTGLLLARQVRTDPLDFMGLGLNKLANLRGRLRLTVQDGYFVSGDGRHCLLWGESVTALTGSGPATLVQAELDRLLAVALPAGVKARVIGPLPHTLANANTIRSDLARLLPAALVALVLVLLLVLRDWRGLVVVAIPFLAAPPAVAILALIYPQPSAMALGFGIVLLGIGVDFAVHLYLGSRVEHGRLLVSPRLRSSLLLAATTTISVFVVLLFSQVPAHRQMATLAIVGLLLALLLAWRLIPLLPGRGREGQGKAVFCLVRPGGRSAVLIVAAWLLLLAGGIGGWSQLQYNGDLKSLDVPTQQVREDEQVFLSTWGREGEQALVVAVAAETGAALDLNDRVYAGLAASGPPAGVQSLAPILPGPTRQRQNLRAWQDFWSSRLPTLQRDLAWAAAEQGFAPGAFKSFLDGLAGDPVPLAPEVLIDGPLRPLLHGLFRQAPGSGEGHGAYLVTTLVPDNPDTAAILSTLPVEIPGVRLLSNSRWRQEMDVLLKGDIIRLTTIAALAVLLICLVVFRNFRIMLAVLAPVLSAQAAMALFAGLTTGELNLMHLLMGIMVIGLSVDYGIFVVTGCLEGVAGHTSLAVTLCALSTLSGFGVLALAAHPALHALGVTVLVGIGAAWPTALLVSPVLAGVRERK
jgi:hypothetical protein